VLRDTSLSTANCSEKHFIVGSHLYCHIMDPRTLRPVEGRLQATVIAPSATDSDALSNAMFVLGATGRRRLMQTLPAADRALVVLAGGSTEKYRWTGH
jgi:thiamine biosynthesis lipoprotein